MGYVPRPESIARLAEKTGVDPDDVAAWLTKYLATAPPLSPEQRTAIATIHARAQRGP